MRQPNIVPHNWHIDRFFLETSNKLGARFEIPSLHAEYVELGPRYSSNVYTAYFAYIDFGLPLMMAIVSLIGFVLASPTEEPWKEAKSPQLCSLSFSVG